MVYALIDEAKRINQKVGITLWSDDIRYTTLPKCLDYREVEKIKKDILDIQKWGGTTNIYLALEQAKEHKDKLFIVLTDGAVYYDDLLSVDNVVFFLIMPEDRDKEAFIRKYGESRVIVINNPRDMPRIVVKWFRLQHS